MVPRLSLWQMLRVRIYPHSVHQVKELQTYVWSSFSVLFGKLVGGREEAVQYPCLTDCLPFHPIPQNAPKPSRQTTDFLYWHLLKPWYNYNRKSRVEHNALSAAETGSCSADEREPFPCGIVVASRCCNCLGTFLNRCGNRWIWLGGVFFYV